MSFRFDFIDFAPPTLFYLIFPQRKLLVKSMIEKGDQNLHLRTPFQTFQVLFSCW